jgi:uncharacterized DUF497 family protein
MDLAQALEQDDPFDWDDANIEHLGWHDVEPYEAEEILYNCLMLSDLYLEEGEWRRDALGRTDNRRMLKVSYTKRDNKIRVCTAKTPNLDEQRRL